MPSVTHEGMLQPFENRPELVAELLADAFGIKLPGWREARVGCPGPAGVPDGATGRLSAASHRGLVCRADRARPSGLGLATAGAGSRRVPVVTDVEQARRSPELAVLSALAHGARHPRWKAVLAAFLASLQRVAGDRAKVYYDVIEAVLPAAARHHLEDLMGATTYEFRGPFALTHIAKGEVRAALAFLQERGIEVPREARERMMACKDPDQAEVWVRRAATARSIDEVLAE